MAQLIYFTRHGKLIPGDTMLSELGKAELWQVGERLRTRGFNPCIVLTSPEIRCVDSVAYFTQTGKVLRDQSLESSGTINMIRRRAQSLLPRLLKFAEGKDALVISHDCVAGVLALCLAEIRGTEIDWGEPHLRYRLIRQERGHGILVIGNSYEFVSP